MQVEFDKVHKVVGAITQGRHDSGDLWITKYRVAYYLVASGQMYNVTDGGGSVKVSNDL